MHTNWLEDFLSVAESGSMSKAAEQRHVSVSTISRNLKRLESWFDVELINQDANQDRLTSAGLSLRDAAQRWINDLQRTSDRISGKRRQHSFRIAAPPMLAWSFFPKWWSLAKQQYEDANCVLLTGNGPHNRRSLESGIVDMLFTYSHPSEDLIYDQQKFEQQIVGQDVLLPCCAPDSEQMPLHALPGSVDSPLPWLANSFNTYLGRIVSNIINNRDDAVYLDMHIESEMVDILGRCAIEGHGVAWIPRSAAKQDLRSGRLVLAGSSEWFIPLEIYIFFTKSRQQQDMRQMINHTVSFSRLMNA